MGMMSLNSLASRVLREHQAAQCDASSALAHAREAGRLLIDAKKLCDGSWIAWLKESCSEISVRTAEAYMRVSRNPQVTGSSINEALSKLSSPAKPTNRRGSANPQAADSPKKTPNKSPPAEDPPEEGPSASELAEAEAAESEYRGSVERVMSASDKLAAAHAEIKRQAAEISALKISRDGFMNGKAQVERLLAAEQRKNARLTKRLRELEGRAKKK